MVCRCRDLKYKIIEFPRSTESGGMVKSEVIVTEPVWTGDIGISI